MRVRDIMIKDLSAVYADTPINYVIGMFNHSEKRSLPVIDNDFHLIGCITVRMLVDKCIPEYFKTLQNPLFLPDNNQFETSIKEMRNEKVENIMGKNIVTVYEDGSITEITSDFLKHSDKTIYVVDYKNHLKGFVDIKHLMCYFACDKKEE